MFVHSCYGGFGFAVNGETKGICIFNKVSEIKLSCMKMINYSMKYGVGEISRYLKVERDLIKTWAYLFSDYLSVDANPGKGKQRMFIDTDI